MVSKVSVHKFSPPPPYADQKNSAHSMKIVKRVLKDAVAEKIANNKPESLRSWKQLWAETRRKPEEPEMNPRRDKKSQAGNDSEALK